MRFEITDQFDGLSRIYKLIYDSPEEEARCWIEKYEHFLEVRRSECIPTPKEEMTRILNAIEYWKKRLTDIQSTFHIPGWDLT